MVYLVTICSNRELLEVIRVTKCLRDHICYVPPKQVRKPRICMDWPEMSDYLMFAFRCCHCHNDKPDMGRESTNVHHKTWRTYRVSEPFTCVTSSTQTEFCAYVLNRRCSRNIQVGRSKRSLPRHLVSTIWCQQWCNPVHVLRRTEKVGFRDGLQKLAVNGPRMMIH